jgi:hypothetical protein
LATTKIFKESRNLEITGNGNVRESIAVTQKKVFAFDFLFFSWKGQVIFIVFIFVESQFGLFFRVERWGYVDHGAFVSRIVRILVILKNLWNAV